MFFNILIICLIDFFVVFSNGAKITNTSVPVSVSEGLSIANQELDRRTKSSEALTTLTTTPPAPTSSTTVYRLVGSNGAACILIRTDGLFEFSYTSTLGDKRQSDTFAPVQFTITGDCENQDDAYITISWKSYRWTVHFQKTPGGEHWYVDKMELIANSEEKEFEHINRPRSTLRFTTPKERPSMLFPTPVGKAYTCSEEAKVEMKDRDVTATVFLRDIKMQPFIFKKDDFGPEHVCSPGSKSYRDETAPIVVGSTLAIATLLTVTGYGIYRYMKVKKVQYDTMK